MSSLFSAAVVAPTYNNASTLADALARITATGLPCILVMDGCTDHSEQVLADYLRDFPSARLEVVRHSRNRGKAAALLTGFAAARRAGHTHGVTIDTDGQLDPEQIPEFADAARSAPTALILGWRDETRPDYPARSRSGRRISNCLVRLECGLIVSDSQCGLRVYPLELFDVVRCGAGRFGFETEIITRAGWANCPIVERQAHCRYFPQDQRVTHFKPVRDSLRAMRMHVRLLIRALLPWPHPLLPSTRAMDASKPNSFWRRLFHWFNPIHAWRQFRGDPIHRTSLAIALALGGFIANLPLYGLQTLLSLYAAKKLHLNPAAVVAGSQLSTPPVGLALNIAAICLGHLILHGSLPYGAMAHPTTGLLIDWAIGSILVGLACALAIFGVMQGFWRLRAGRERSSIHRSERLLNPGVIVSPAVPPATSPDATHLARNPQPGARF